MESGHLIRRKKRSTMRKWENMSYDVLVRIFETFNIMDLVLSFSGVCSAWYSACCDPFLWETMDLSALGNYFIIPAEPYAWSDENSAQTLMFILEDTLELSCGNVKNLVFNFYTYITDDHLIYAAQRCPKLKKLVLPLWNGITFHGFERALRMLENLESLIVPCISSTTYALLLLTDNCHNFKELKVMCPLDMEFASSIIVFMSKIRVLSLRCAIVHVDALELMLGQLHHLEVLNITHSLLIFQPASVPTVFVFHYLHDSLLEKTSRLREFYTCQRDSCSVCPNTFVDEDGFIKWHDYEEELWRQDEVTSLAY